MQNRLQACHATRSQALRVDSMEDHALAVEVRRADVGDQGGIVPLGDQQRQRKWPQQPLESTAPRTLVGPHVQQLADEGQRRLGETQRGRDGGTQVEHVGRDVGGLAAHRLDLAGDVCQLGTNSPALLTQRIAALVELLQVSPGCLDLAPGIGDQLREAGRRLRQRSAQLPAGLLGLVALTQPVGAQHTLRLELSLQAGEPIATRGLSFRLQPLQLGLRGIEARLATLRFAAQTVELHLEALDRLHV